MIKSLADTTHTHIVDCLHEAFSDYTIPMKMPYEYWQQRWLMSNIDYTLSYGFFDNTALKGFILHGIDFWKEEKCFYNMATGVVPDFRRRGLLTKIYISALEKLKEAGCQSGYLEVLCNNLKAIKAYEKCGFKIVDEMHSYLMAKDLSAKDDYIFKKKNNPSAFEYTYLLNHKLSFEHRSEIINRNPSAFSFFELYDNSRLVAFAIVKESNYNIVQFGFIDNQMEVYGPSLFAKLAEVYTGLKLVNISVKDEALHDFFRKNRFGTLISQYMMRVQL